MERRLSSRPWEGRLGGGDFPVAHTHRLGVCDWECARGAFPAAAWEGAAPRERHPDRRLSTHRRRLKSSNSFILIKLAPPQGTPFFLTNRDLKTTGPGIAHPARTLPTPVVKRADLQPRPCSGRRAPPSRGPCRPDFIGAHDVDPVASPGCAGTQTSVGDEPRPRTPDRPPKLAPTPRSTSVVPSSRANSDALGAQRNLAAASCRPCGPTNTSETSGSRATGQPHDDLQFAPLARSPAPIGYSLEIDRAGPCVRPGIFPS